MIAGVGIDIVEIRRISASLERFGPRFAAKILTTPEERNGLTPAKQSAYLARQFAAKEAVAKALGTGMRHGIHFRTILVLRDQDGAPYIRLLGSAADRAAAMSVGKVLISISDEREYAIAYAIAVEATSR